MYNTLSRSICQAHFSCHKTGHDLVAPVTSSVEDSELIIHFQEDYARFFSVAITNRIFSQTCFHTDQ